MKVVKVLMFFLLIGMVALQAEGKERGKKPYEQALFDTSKLASINLEMPDTTWQNILNQANKKEYRLCSITINGERLDSVAIRTKGASSLDDVSGMKSNRYSFTIKLNKFKKKQNYHGLSKLLLNNNIWDATQVKDAIVYDMAHFMELPAPLTNYTRLNVNGQLHGYYLAVEPVDKDFCKRNYPNEKSSIYRPYHNLAYSGDSLKAYGAIFDDTKVGGKAASQESVVAAIKSVYRGYDIEKHLDVACIMKYLALQTIAVNYDSMTGHNMQNWYLHEGDGRISIVPWDYNLAWGGYPDDDFSMDAFGNFDPSQWDNLPGAGEHAMEDGEHQEGKHHTWDMPMGGFGEGFQISKPGEDLGKSTPEEVSQIVNFPINTPFTDKLEKRKFFMNLLANDTYKSLYYQYLELLCKKYIMGGGMRRFLNGVNRQIGKKAGTEKNAFYTNKQFHTGTQMLSLMLERKAKSILGQIDGTVPSTWEAQKENPAKLINSDDINLRLTGGLGY